jgi:flagellar M-ring protein FliF
MPTALQPYLDRLGGERRALLIGVGVLAALLIFGLSRWATAPTWVPLFTGLPLETVGDVTQRLDEENVRYRLERGGAEVLVPASDVARARVRLAKDGLPSAGRPGLELFDQPSWGMTDFSQRINYRRALEGELERTIGKMRGVESAQVHLGMQEGRPASAPRTARPRRRWCCGCATARRRPPTWCRASRTWSPAASTG